MHFPGRPVYPWPKGKVPKAKLHDTIMDIVLSDRTLGITLVSSRQDDGLLEPISRAAADGHRVKARSDVCEHAE